MLNLADWMGLSAIRSIRVNSHLPQGMMHCTIAIETEGPGRPVGRIQETLKLNLPLLVPDTVSLVHRKRRPVAQHPTDEAEPRVPGRLSTNASGDVSSDFLPIGDVQRPVRLPCGPVSGKPVGIRVRFRADLLAPCSRERGGRILAVGRVEIIRGGDCDG